EDELVVLRHAHHAGPVPRVDQRIVLEHDTPCRLDALNSDRSPGALQQPATLQHLPSGHPSSLVESTSRRNAGASAGAALTARANLGPAGVRRRGGGALNPPLG